MSKPCEYCGCDLPLGVDKKTRQQRSHHFAACKARPVFEVEPLAQRTWVGLTEEEFQAICKNFRITHGGWIDMLALEIEAKLKEKNT